MTTARILLFALIPFVFACSSNRPVRGRIHKPAVGSQYADFVFIDDLGASRSFRNLLGDFTVLAFTRCDLDTHGSVARVLEETVSEHWRTPFVEVVGVDIHWFEGECSHEQCHLVAGGRGVVSICDATGAIHRMYGVAQEDRLLAVDSNGRLILDSPSREVASFRKNLRDHVVALSRIRAEELHEEYQEIQEG